MGSAQYEIVKSYWPLALIPAVSTYDVELAANDAVRTGAVGRIVEAEEGPREEASELEPLPLIPSGFAFHLAGDGDPEDRQHMLALIRPQLSLGQEAVEHLDRLTQDGSVTLRVLAYISRCD
jgi:hypothetical protein